MGPFTDKNKFNSILLHGKYLMLGKCTMLPNLLDSYRMMFEVLALETERAEKTLRYANICHSGLPSLHFRRY